MQSPTTTDSGDDHPVQPVRVGQIKGDDDAVVEWQRFASFRPSSQAETLQRRQWGAFGAKMVQSLQESLQSCRNYRKTVSSVMDSMMLMSQMNTTVTLESNIRTEWINEAPLDRAILDQLELDNFIAIDRHVAMACRFFGIDTPQPETNMISMSWLRQHIDSSMDRLLECLKQIDPAWANKLNECAKDVQLARMIEQLLVEVGDAHRGACQAKDCWKNAYEKYFHTLDSLEKIIFWVYNADRAAAGRRQAPTSNAVAGRAKSTAGKGEEELQTQLRWMYMAALDFARDRRRFVELCYKYLDIANEVRQQRYDPENVVVSFRKRPAIDTGLAELASRLFSAYWDEQLERFTQLRIVSDEAKRLVDTWRRENKRYAALAAECDELSRQPEAKLKALENLALLLETNRRVGQDLINCLETIVPTLKQVTARLQQENADREKAKAEAMKKGAAAAFDPALDDPVYTEIERKERRLEESLLRRQDAKLGRAECLQNLQHQFCHREKERERLQRNCDDLEAELNRVNEELTAANEENDRLAKVLRASPKAKGATSGDGADDADLLNRIESFQIEIARKKRKLDTMQLRMSNLALKIRCVGYQKKILESACAEKEATIREFQRHANDTKKAIEDRRRRRSSGDDLPPIAGREQLPKGDKLKRRIREYADILKGLLTESDATLRKYSDISGSNLRKMEEHHNWCFKNVAKEMELDWNRMQLRKILCERGQTVADQAPTTPPMVVAKDGEDHYHRYGVKQPPPSPVILYHELSTPERERVQQGKAPLMTSYYSRHKVGGDRKTFTIKESVSYSHSLSISRTLTDRTTIQTETAETGQPSTVKVEPGANVETVNTDTTTTITVRSPRAAGTQMTTPTQSPSASMREADSKKPANSK